MKLRIILTLLISLVLAGCTRAGFAAANLPTVFSSTEATRNIAFGTVPGLKLDVYAPKIKSAAPRDVVFFVYGGRWQSGSKSDYEFVAETFADKGYIVVIPDYRKYPDVKFPTFIEDTAAAFAWTYANIEKFGGNTARIHVAGHSAGAHTVALLASDTKYLKAFGLDAHKVIKSVAGLAGPYNFVPDEKDLMDIFGPPENYPMMQVPTFITGQEAPMLLLQGTKDTTVKARNLEGLAAKIKEMRGRVETKLYNGVDHIWIAGALSWLGHNKPDVASDMDSFFKSVK